MPDNDHKADANPTKTFFVTMITRDITLEDSILDLIDNSLDGAWKSEGSLPVLLRNGTNLSAYSISIYATPEHFTISDNCGGMTLDDAIDHAFSFGRKATQVIDQYGIGVYGIGMKRAGFKIGRRIRVTSTYSETDGSRQSFAVPILVDDWIENDRPPWDFDIVEADHLENNGVLISIGQLTPATKTSFSNPAFIQNLRRTIARDYSLYLHKGLNIHVNDEPVTGLPIQLRESDEYAPIRIDYVDDTTDDEVMVEIIGGMAAPPPESADPDESSEGDKRFGWYVACNGRIVLAADKSNISGWGTGDWPQWHSQYSGFVGIILFSSPNAAALPLTTTKRSVDLTSEVFLRSRPRMRDVSKQWIAYTNSRKQALEAAKQKELAAVNVSIHDVKKRNSVVLPQLIPVQVERQANVNYAVPQVKMRKLAKALGSIRMAYRDVGLRSFKYTYEDLVEDE